MSDAEPLLVDTGRGFTIRYQGRTLYSSVDPARRPRDLGQQAPIPERTLLFVPSLGLGYGLPELLGRLPPGGHILCIEADQRLMALAVAPGAAELPQDPRLTVVRTADPQAACSVLQALGPGRFRRIVSLPLCGGYSLQREVYDRILAALQEDLRIHWRNRLTLFHFSGLWLKNLFANLQLLPESGDAAGLRTSRPVVVAGAGPSLEERLDWIRAVREDVFLLAADTALPVLTRFGLEPDGICCLDAQFFNLMDFIPAPAGRALLLCDLAASPQAARLFPQRRCFFSTRFAELRLFERLASAKILPFSLPPQGSVGVAAVSLALKLTSGPVILAGLDFGYPGLRTHARESPAHLGALFGSFRLEPLETPAFQALRRRPLLTLAGKSGLPVLSDMVLRSYSLQMLGIAEGAGGRVYDAGPEGLPCGGRPLEDLEELKLLVQRRRAPAPAKIARAPMSFACFARKNVKAFLDSEAALLEEAEGLLQQGTAARLLDLLHDLDYLWRFQPGFPPEELSTQDLEPGCLRRLIASCRYFRERLGRRLSLPRS